MNKFTSLVVVLSLFTACLSSAQKTAFTGTFEACAKADLGSVITNVEEQVAALVAADGANLEADLAALIASVGIDTVDCAVAAVEAEQKAGSGSGSGSAVSAAAVHGLIRAKAVVAEKRGGKTAQIQKNMNDINSVVQQALAAVGQ